MTTKAAQWRSLVRRHQGLSGEARLLGILLAPYWRGHGMPLGAVSVYDLYLRGNFPTWEAYDAALSELHAYGFISRHGRRGRPNMLLWPDLPNLHMAGAAALLSDRLEVAP